MDGNNETERGNFISQEEEKSIARAVHGLARENTIQ